MMSGCGERITSAVAAAWMNEALLMGVVVARWVATATEKNVAVAAMDLGERRLRPQRKCPLVQPDPSCRAKHV